MLSVFLINACTALEGVLSDLDDRQTRPGGAHSDVNPAFQTVANQPRGGENTISVSVANCFNCPMVNLMFDPDGYWQRTENERVLTGQTNPQLYKSLVQIMAGFGLYTWPNQTTILPAIEDTCPKYFGEGQFFFISLGLGGQRRQTLFDGGCAGSDFADRATGAINQISAIKTFQDILAGSHSATPITSPSVGNVTNDRFQTMVGGSYPLPPSLKPWG